MTTAVSKRHPPSGRNDGNALDDEQLDDDDQLEDSADNAAADLDGQAPELADGSAGAAK